MAVRLRVLQRGSSLTKFDVVSVEVVNLRLGEHSVVFKFSSSDCWAVVWDQDQLGLSLSQALEGGLVTYHQDKMSDQWNILAAWCLSSLWSAWVTRWVANLPSLYLPDLMTSASFWFMLSWVFFAATELIAKGRQCHTQAICLLIF